jgi:hypothetical protein
MGTQRGREFAGSVSFRGRLLPLPAAWPTSFISCATSWYTTKLVGVCIWIVGCCYNSSHQTTIIGQKAETFKTKIMALWGGGVERNIASRSFVYILFTRRVCGGSDQRI